MQAPALSFSKEVFEAASQIEILPQRRLAALLSGQVYSPYQGSGMQFKEFRNYEPGDDIRHMSWTLTARVGKPMVKIYEEDRELDIVVLLDTSGSRESGIYKKRVDCLIELSATLGFASTQGGNNFGLLLFSDKSEHFLPPRKSKEQVRSGLNQYLKMQWSGNKSDLRTVLVQTTARLRNRSLVIIFSDFEMPDFSKQLKILSQRHEVILAHVFTKEEAGLKKAGFWESWDPESGKFWLWDAGSTAFQSQLQKRFEEKKTMLTNWARQARAQYFLLNQDGKYLQNLVDYFKRRA